MMDTSIFNLMLSLDPFQTIKQSFFLLYFKEMCQKKTKPIPSFSDPISVQISTINTLGLSIGIHYKPLQEKSSRDLIKIFENDGCFSSAIQYFLS